MQKLVSVNITTFNRAHLLPRCLESIFSQSYKNIEIIVVDDCSNDNTQKIMEQYLQDDGRIKYFRHKINKKNAHARNTALENSSGDYIAFMDDDDEWIDKDKIKKQVKLFESINNHKLGIICSSVRLYSNINIYKDKIIKKPDDFITHILSKNSLIYSPSVMTKKDIMIEVGGFDINIPRGVDSDFYRNCIIKYGYDVYFMEDVTTAIHEYGDNRMTKSKNCNSLLNHIDTQFYNIKKYFKYFLYHPKAFVIRAKSIGILSLEFFKCNIKNKEHKN